MFWEQNRDRRLIAERLHYTVVRHLVDNNDFNAIKYLYDRLNIIDAKAQGLLTRNALLLTVVSILGSVKLRGDKYAGQFLSSLCEQWAFAIGFLLLGISTVSTLYWMFFRFDHITEVPAQALERMEQLCQCKLNGTLGADGKAPPGCPLAKSCGIALASEFASHIGAQKHSLEQYEDLFFSITIDRQDKLRFAQRATFVASIVFFLLIAYIFWLTMDHLHFSLC
jgi:hypothetical protein